MNSTTINSSKNEEKTIDSKGKEWRTHKDTIEKLADLMNEQSIHPMQTSDELFHIFDAVLSTKEIDFMLKMGGGNHTLESVKNRVSIPDNEVQNILDSLVYKGPIAIIKNESGKDVYHIMTIFPGWFELYLMRGVENEESRLFAKRVEELFEAAYKFGNEEVINQLLRDIGPHIKVLSAGSTKTKSIELKKEINHENRIFATKSIMSIMNELDENETITIGHCFCRFEKELINDPCRAGMPLESCISIGPAAEYLLKQGIAKKISKAEAIAKIKEFQDKGCIHQATRTIPIKDFQIKYPIDIFCNCCWDCCGIIGNYNRGYLPYILYTFHRAKIPDEDNCIGCRNCIKYCPVRAIQLNSASKAVIKDNLCIGCGQCYHHCSDNAIELIEDEREVFLPMLDKSEARIKPKDFHEQDDKIDYSKLTIGREEVFKVLESTRQKFISSELTKVFKKWNKSILYYFTDLNEHWHFKIIDGKPGPLKQGEIENPSISYILSGPVFVGLMRGEIDGFKAFRKKLVKVKAPVKDLIKLQKLID